MNGGAWLTVGGARVDLIYRDLDEVLRWTAAAEEGRFEIRREVGYGRGTGPGPGAGGRTAPAGVPDPAACEPGQAVVTFALRFAVLRPLFGKANKMSFPFPCQAPFLGEHFLLRPGAVNRATPRSLRAGPTPEQAQDHPRHCAILLRRRPCGLRHKSPSYLRSE